MVADSKVFTLEGKALKLDTAADVEAHLKPLRDMDDVEEVRLQGNTIGIEAAAALADVLKTKKTLKVCLFHQQLCAQLKLAFTNISPFRSLTLPTSSPVACFPRFQPPFLPSLLLSLSFQTSTPLT